ncbi:hypothetical protein [Tenacibaculum singaporense]|uniref:hypothetical protein n=1 Tax=Tenacibaculum singaporense TaxID=2358479 RepID=UPI000F670D31|nr:hypothetical protein [Tenacibaculum singaporense]RSC95898.1 hypothetical protein EI424_01945 [Tenacibaculum singaporense]
MEYSNIEILKEIAYKYYPRGISSISNHSLYAQSSENKFLLETIKSNVLKAKINSLIYRLEKELKLGKVMDFTLFEWVDRCYNLQCLISDKNKVKQIFCINISVITNYYTCYVLEVREKNDNFISGFPKRDITLSSNISFPSNVKEVEKLIEESLSYDKIPLENLNYSFQDINFQDFEMGKFTLFNAFFLNNYYTQF